MDRKPHFRGGLLLALALAFPAFAQQSSSSSQTSSATNTATPAKPKPKRVWTNDSIAEVRTPADDYLDQEEAAEQAAKANAAKAGSTTPDQGAVKPVGAPPIVLKIPKTAEEAQKALSQRRDMLDNFSNLLSITQDQISKETDPQVRATLEQKAKLLNADVNSTTADIKTLEKVLKDLEQGKTPEQPKAPASDQAKTPQQGKAALNKSVTLHFPAGKPTSFLL